MPWNSEGRLMYGSWHFFCQSTSEILSCCLTRLKVHHSVDRCKTKLASTLSFCIIWHDREGNPFSMVFKRCHYPSPTVHTRLVCNDGKGRLTYRQLWQWGGRRLCTKQIISRMPLLSALWSLVIVAMVDHSYSGLQVPKKYLRLICGSVILNQIWTYF